MTQNLCPYLRMAVQTQRAVSAATLCCLDSAVCAHYMWDTSGHAENIQLRATIVPQTILDTLETTVAVWVPTGLMGPMAH